MSTIKKVFPVLQMGCAACANRVETTVKNAVGVASAAVNFASAELSVEYDPAVMSPEKLRDVVRNAGYDLVIEDQSAAADTLDEIKKKK